MYLEELFPMTTTQAVTLQQIEASLKQDYYEREEAIRVMLLALLGRFNAVLIGAPGSAKTDLMVALAESFYDAQTGNPLSHFAYQLNEFVSDNDLFGPPNVPVIMTGGYERNVAGRLPEGDLVLLDEVFKATTLLNTLLEVMNERTYTNGTKKIDVRAQAFFGTSNEMPQGEGLEALWDRFHLRCVVEYIKDQTNMRSLFTRRATRGTNTRKPRPVRMSIQDLLLLQAHVPTIAVPGSIIDILLRLRADLTKNYGITASDRRWAQCIDMLQANALLEGRTQVEEDDFAVLNHVLWDVPEKRDDVKKMTARLANPIVAKANEIKDAAIKMWQQTQQDLAARSQPGQEGDRAVIAMQSLSKVNTSKKELEKLVQQMKDEGNPTTRIDQAVRVVNDIHTKVLAEV
jgi:MoxR-like ATPase